MSAPIRHPQPFTCAVGTENQFGWLHSPDGFVLVEPRMFGDGRALVIDLLSGAPRHELADGTLQFYETGARRACQLAGIPEPVMVDGRRQDLFHVERHRSGVFAAVSEFIRDLPMSRGQLICNERSVPDVDGFASAVVMRMAGNMTAADAVSAELAARGIRRSGWARAISDLDELVAEHQTKLTCGGTPALLAAA